MRPAAAASSQVGSGSQAAGFSPLNDMRQRPKGNQQEDGDGSGGGDSDNGEDGVLALVEERSAMSRSLKKLWRRLSRRICGVMTRTSAPSTAARQAAALQKSTPMVP
ncbi:unnamed protein product [Urochloa humidicola]